jgi:hypothetical protein
LAGGVTDDEQDNLPETLDKRDALEVAAGGAFAAGPSLAEMLVHGGGAVMAGATGSLMSLLNLYTRKQTERLFEELRARVLRLEDAGKLDRERLDRLGEMGAFQAAAANAVSSPEKTELYADVLAGVVSVDAPEALDVESLIATLQNLSVHEVDLARQMNDEWERERTHTGVQVPWTSEDRDYYASRLEGAGLIVPQVRTGPPGSGVHTRGYLPSPTLARLVRLLRAGRAEDDAVP